MRRADMDRLRECVPGEGPLRVAALGGGWVNDSYRVERDGEAYALRLRAPGAVDLGQDPASELRVLRAAVAARLAPDLVFADTAGRMLLSRWVPGAAWDPATAAQPGNTVRMAAVMQRIHALQVAGPVRAMDPAQWIHYYCAARGAANTHATALRAAADAHLSRLAMLPAGPRAICHSDLHRLNVVDAGRAVYVLDWEYAHSADPLWDVAGWCCNNDFDRQAQSRLAQAYFGRDLEAEERARMGATLWLYDYVCLLWCELQLAMAPETSVDARARMQLLAARLAASH